MQSHKTAQRHVDSAREESVLTTEDSTELIKKLEEERLSISKIADESLDRMTELFDKLSEKSREKYLKE